MNPSYGLLVDCQGGSSRRVEFASARVIIGRDAGDLVLPDSQISTNHAELLFDGRSLVLRDLDSTNGTWINGQRISSLELAPGMSVTLGQHRLTYLGLAGGQPGRGRTVAVPQASGAWNPPTAPGVPWQPPYPPAPQAYPPAEPPRSRGSGLAILLFVLLGIVVVGILGVGGFALFMVNRVVNAGDTTERPSDQPASASSVGPGEQQASESTARPSQQQGTVQAEFGSRAFRSATIAASSGKDPRNQGRVVEIHAAPSAAALATRSEVLSLGLRADRPGTYTVGPTAAAISFSVGEEEHYLARPGVKVEVARLDPEGEIDGSFAGDFDHEVSGNIVGTVQGKGVFRAMLH